MKIFRNLLLATLITFNANSAELNAASLNLTPEQNKHLIELKNNLKAEIQPIWEEIETNQQRILEIEKKYFEEFWNSLTDEQKQRFAEINQQ